MLVVTAMSCNSEKLNSKEATSLIESFLAATDKKDFKDISNFYSEAMKSGEPENARIEKLLALRQLLGETKQVDLESSTDTVYNNNPALYLVYKIKHAKVTSTQEYMVVKEEGKYKIAQQNVESVN